MGGQCTKLEEQQKSFLITPQDEKQTHTCQLASNYCFPQKNAFERVDNSITLKQNLDKPIQPSDPGSPMLSLNEVLCQPKQLILNQFAVSPTRRNALSYDDARDDLRFIKYINSMKIIGEKKTMPYSQISNFRNKQIMKKQLKSESPKKRKEVKSVRFITSNEKLEGIQRRKQFSSQILNLKGLRDLFQQHIQMYYTSQY